MSTRDNIKVNGRTKKRKRTRSVYYILEKKMNKKLHNTGTEYFMKDLFRENLI